MVVTNNSSPTLTKIGKTIVVDAGTITQITTTTTTEVTEVRTAEAATRTTITIEEVVKGVVPLTKGRIITPTLRIGQMDRYHRSRSKVSKRKLVRRQQLFL